MFNWPSNTVAVSGVIVEKASNCSNTGLLTQLKFQTPAKAHQLEHRIPEFLMQNSAMFYSQFSGAPCACSENSTLLSP